MKTISIIASIVLILHGLIHLMGTVTYMKLGTVQGLTYKTTLLGRDIGETGMWVYGAQWVVAAIGFVVTAVALLAGWEWWRPALVMRNVFFAGADFPGIERSRGWLHPKPHHPGNLSFWSIHCEMDGALRTYRKRIRGEKL